MLLWPNHRIPRIYISCFSTKIQSDFYLNRITKKRTGKSRRRVGKQPVHQNKQQHSAQKRIQKHPCHDCGVHPMPKKSIDFVDHNHQD